MHTRSHNAWVRKKGGYKQKRKRYNRLNSKPKTAEPTYERSYIEDDEEVGEFIVVDVGDRTFENSPRTRSISNEATFQVDEEIGDRVFENNSPETRPVSNEVTLQVDEEILQNDGKALETWAQDALLMLDYVPTIVGEEGVGELSTRSSEDLVSADDLDVIKVASSYAVNENKENENTGITGHEKIKHRDAEGSSHLTPRLGVESTPFIPNDPKTYQSPYPGDFRSADQPSRTLSNSSVLPGIPERESIQNQALTTRGIGNSMGIDPVVEGDQGQNFGLILRTFMSATLSQLSQSSGSSNSRQHPPAPILLEPSWTLASAVPSAFPTKPPFSPGKEYRPPSGHDDIETKVPRVSLASPQPNPFLSIPTRSTSHVESIQNLSPPNHKTSKSKPHNAELPVAPRTAIDKKKLRDRAETLISWRLDVELEDDETTGGRNRTNPDVCGAVVDRRSGPGIVVVTAHGSPERQVDTGFGDMSNGSFTDISSYADLAIGPGETCVIYGDSTVLYYRPRKVITTSQGPQSMSIEREHEIPATASVVELKPRRVSIPNQAPQSPNISREHGIPITTPKVDLVTRRMSLPNQGQHSSDVQCQCGIPPTTPKVNLETRRMSILTQGPQSLDIEREHETPASFSKADLEPWRITMPIQGLQRPYIEKAHTDPPPIPKFDSEPQIIDLTESRPQSPNIEKDKGTQAEIITEYSVTKRRRGNIRPSRAKPRMIPKAPTTLRPLMPIKRTQLREEPTSQGFTLRLQTAAFQEKAPEFFGRPYDMSPILRNLKTTEFFSWFSTETGRSGLGGTGPAELSFAFKHSKLDWALKVRTVLKHNEDDFRYFRKEILAQYEKARECDPNMKEYVVFVSDPSWRRSRS